MHQLEYVVESLLCYAPDLVQVKIDSKVASSPPRTKIKKKGGPRDLEMDEMAGTGLRSEHN